MNPREDSHDPFARLGIAPTFDPVAIKRAYFARVAVCPPHGRGGEFRALRAAYEALATPDLRVRAFLGVPPAAADLASWHARHDAALAAARERAAANAARRESVERFVATHSRMTLAEALGRDPNAPAT